MRKVLFSSKERMGESQLAYCTAEDVSVRVNSVQLFAWCDAGVVTARTSRWIGIISLLSWVNTMTEWNKTNHISTIIHSWRITNLYYLSTDTFWHGVFSLKIQSDRCWGTRCWLCKWLEGVHILQNFVSHNHKRSSVIKAALCSWLYQFLIWLNRTVIVQVQGIEYWISRSRRILNNVSPTLSLFGAYSSEF